jgi:hypothetical protein
MKTPTSLVAQFCTAVIAIAVFTCLNPVKAKTTKGKLELPNQRHAQSNSSESLEELRTEIEHFLQEENYKEIRTLCSLESIKQLRVQHAPFW